MWYNDFHRELRLGAVLFFAFRGSSAAGSPRLKINAKSPDFSMLFGTAEAVPSPKAFMTKRRQAAALQKAEKEPV